MAPSGQVLDELTELAAVEHAVIAEYLQIAYVLGHRLPDPAPGPAGPAIADAAQKILSMAQFVEMKHLKLVNEFLVASGRPAQLGQAVGIDHSLGSGAMTDFGPLREDDLLALVERETALAKAGDEGSNTVGRSRRTDQVKAIAPPLLHGAQPSAGQPAALVWNPAGRAQRTGSVIG